MTLRVDAVGALATGTRTPGRPVSRAVRVSPVIRAALYLFVLSIPFEMPERPIPIEIPTMTGAIFLCTALLQPGTCFRRMPAALLSFGVYLWVFGVTALVNGLDHPAQTLRMFLVFLQLILLFWVIYNVLEDDRILRGMLLALIAACIVRAGLQVTGIATAALPVSTGGVRLSTLGQNTNLSAIILSVGLAAVLGLQLTRQRRIPRPGFLVWPLAALIGLAVIQTGSRGGLFCAAAGLAAYLFRGRTLGLRLRNGVLAVFALGMLAWGAYASELTRSRFEEAAEEGHLAGREDIYPAALEAFVERPLLGWGPIDNHYEIARRIREPMRDHREPHNLVLELLTSTGFAGALPFLIAVGLCVRGAWRARRGPFGILPFAMLAAALTGTVAGTWIAARILWLTFAIGLAAGTYWSAPENPRTRLRTSRAHVRPAVPPTPGRAGQRRPARRAPDTRLPREVSP